MTRCLMPPGLRCPHCAQPVDVLRSETDERPPQVGDVLVCNDCGGWARLDVVHPHLLPLTEADLAALPPDVVEHLQRIRADVLGRFQ